LPQKGVGLIERTGKVPHGTGRVLRKVQIFKKSTLNTRNPWGGKISEIVKRENVSRLKKPKERKKKDRGDSKGAIRKGD